MRAHIHRCRESPHELKVVPIHYDDDDDDDDACGHKLPFDYTIDSGIRVM